MRKIFISCLLVAFACMSFAQQKINIKINDRRDSMMSPSQTSKQSDFVPLLVSASDAPEMDSAIAIRLRSDQLVWKDAAPPLTPGAKVAVLEGSPKAEGMFTIRLKLPAHWLLPAHWHSADERVTVLSGSVYVGFGDKLVTKEGIKFSAGSFYVNPAKSHHYVFTGDEETIIQITAQGPWGLTYVEEKK